ncbi:sialate O-acetylesterase [Clostridium sp. AL.422]|uniref:sialate O-acetylesterase n=1 Tax=Clostridium TaxID=1485 RepID=UPI00293DF618|nr:MULTISPECIES: sialate O-acetylesterase [unclassified Clostridium]MDV4151040.1 sialate O-acetylesterase [Clostridium sp. AL.422]
MSNLSLSSILSDGMVIQRGSKTKIYGKAQKNKKIIVEFLNETYETYSDNNGEWQVKLHNLQAGGPYEMLIKSDKELRIKDILIGDVWICSGQSNMELSIERVKELYANQISGYSNDNIRQFLASQNYSFEGPQNELQYGGWKSVNPETILDFTAVGYFFAKELYDRYKVPIGLISTAVGGTPIEAWMSKESLKSFNRFDELIASCEDAQYVITKQKEDDDRINNWYKEMNLKDEGLDKWSAEDLDDSSWNDIVIPGMWRDTALDKVDGAVWFRKEIYLPKSILNNEAKLYLGTIIDADEVYINGEFVGKTEYRYPPRNYSVNRGILKEGKNVISVRVISNTGIGGFIKDKIYKLVFDNEEIELSGAWKYKIGCKMNSNFDRTFFQYMPTGLYNTVIYPLKDYAIAGAIWYQGESNTWHPDDYEELFKTLLKEWRNNWDIGDFPFLYVQLANYAEPSQIKNGDDWARLREAQRRSLKNSNTGMAVTIDIGENNELHPFNKKEVGRRLALLAINKYYGEDIVCNGPLYKEMKKNNDKINIYFESCESELLGIQGDLNNFMICGEDNRYYEAEAEIKGDHIEVWSREVKAPKNVRYAWKNGLENINLYNKEGLPASPFTTEDKF